MCSSDLGWQNGPNPGVGWWVGWVEKGGRTYPFALNLDIRQRADGELRQQLGRAALELLGVLPAAQPPAAAAGSRNPGSSASQRLR